MEKFYVIILSALMVAIALVVIGIPYVAWVTSSETLTNPIDVAQHYGFTVETALSVPHGQTITFYTNGNEQPDFAQWIQALNTAQPSVVYSVPKSSNWFLNFAPSPHVYFIDKAGVIYLLDGPYY